MLSKEMTQRISILKSDDQIIDFIDERIKELEQNAETKTVIAEPDTEFADYIGNKVRYLSINNYYNMPILVYDDFTPYINLIRTINNTNPRMGFVGTLDSIFRTIYDYMGNQGTQDNENLRLQIYFDAKKRGEDFVSIREFADNKCAFCSENAGLSHNMFKILGIDSKLASGTKVYSGIRELHAFNLVYPNGYDGHKIMLFDPSHFISFQDQQDNKVSLPYFIKVSEEEYEYMRAGIMQDLDIKATVDLIQGCFGPYKSAEYDEGRYTIGIKGTSRSQEILDSMQSDESNNSQNKTLVKEKQ